MAAAGIATRIADDDGFNTDVEMLQDILYDILATGTDAGQTSATIADIECFLHEHARAPKSRAAFHEFFDRHGLRADTCTSESVILELPPISTSRELSAAVAESPIELTLSDIEQADFDEDPFAPPPPPVPRRWWSRRGVALACFAVGVLLALLAWRAYSVVTELRAEVSRASERHQQDRSAIQHLSDQTANLESSVAATSELVQRMDQKSDLLIDSLLPRPKSIAKPRVAQLLPPSPDPTPAGAAPSAEAAALH